MRNAKSRVDPDYEQKLALAIHKRFVEKGEFESAQDEFMVLQSMGNEWSHKQSEVLRSALIDRLRVRPEERGYKVLREALKYDARVSFDVFMQFMEWERDPEKRLKQSAACQQ